jgi:hypothetical protein
MLATKAYQKVNKYEQLGQYNLSKYPNTGDYLCPLFDSNLNRHLTGFDENDPQILRIQDKKEREAKQKEVKEKREQLQALTGIDDLSYKNVQFWDGYVIPFVVDMKGNVREFHPESNPMDELALIVLKRRGDIPFSKSEMHDPRFRNAKFYLTSEEEEVSFNKTKIRMERKRSVEMTALFEDEQTGYDRAWNVTFYLGLKPKKNISFDKLEEDLETYTTEGNKYENTLEAFFEACKLSNEELIIANTFKRAVIYGIIKYNSSDKLFYRGGLNYRGTEKESIEYFKTPDMAGELAELIGKVKKHEANRKNIAG